MTEITTGSGHRIQACLILSCSLSCFVCFVPFCWCKGTLKQVDLLIAGFPLVREFLGGFDLAGQLLHHSLLCNQPRGNGCGKEDMAVAWLSLSAVFWQLIKVRADFLLPYYQCFYIIVPWSTHCTLSTTVNQNFFGGRGSSNILFGNH